VTRVENSVHERLVPCRHVCCTEDPLDGGVVRRPGGAPSPAARNPRRRNLAGKRGESMTGPLLTLFYSSARLDKDLTGWLGAIKTAAEHR